MKGSTKLWLAVYVTFFIKLCHINYIALLSDNILAVFWAIPLGVVLSWEIIAYESRHRSDSEVYNISIFYLLSFVIRYINKVADKYLGD